MCTSSSSTVGREELVNFRPGMAEDLDARAAYEKRRCKRVRRGARICEGVSTHERPPPKSGRLALLNRAKSSSRTRRGRRNDREKRASYGAWTTMAELGENPACSAGAEEERRAKPSTLQSVERGRKLVRAERG